MFNDDLGMKVKHIDVVAWMNAEKGNPLLLTLQKSMKTGGLESTLAGDDGSMLEIGEGIDALLVDIVIDPPLTEQGNDPNESISLLNVLLEHKMMVFKELTGGAQYGKLAEFRQAPSSDVLAVPKSEDVSQVAE